MKSDRIVNPSKIADYVMEYIRTSILKRLLEYCKRRVVEVGLTAGGLVSEYSLNSGLNESRKTIVRLKTLIFKYLIKRIPYLALTQGEFLQIANRDHFVVTLQSPEMTSDFAYMDWVLITGSKKPFTNLDLFAASGSYLNVAAQENPRSKWVARYSNYLNFLFRKYCMPLVVEFSCQVVFNQALALEAYELGKGKFKDGKIPFTIRTTFTFSFCKWRAMDEDMHDRVRNGEEPEGNYYSNTSNWISSDLLARRADQYPRAYRYSPEKFFLHLDKIIIALSSLTRKAHYETSAYSFRSNPDS